MIASLKNEHQIASYNHYDTSGAPSVIGSFQQSAQMGPQAILDANGLGKVDNNAGIQTAPAGIQARAVDVGLNMQPQPSSIFGDIAGAICGLSKDVSHTVSGPKVQAVINPDQVIASLDQTPSPVMQAYTPKQQGFGA